MPHARTILYALYFYLIASFDNRFWRPFLHGLLKHKLKTASMHTSAWFVESGKKLNRNIILWIRIIVSNRSKLKGGRLDWQAKRKRKRSLGMLLYTFAKRYGCVCGGGGDYTLPPRFRHLCEMIPMSTGSLDLKIFPSSSTFSKQTSLMVIIN